MVLRALESHEVVPVGGTSARRVDVRVVAATDANLEERSRAGRFAEALFHRLAGFEITLPALRARRDDLARMLVRFLREELTRTGELHRMQFEEDAASRGSPPWIPASLVARLLCLPWTGNVRQLRNFVRQLVISNRGESVLRLDATIEKILGSGMTGSSPRAPTIADEPRSATDTGRHTPAPRRRPSEITDEEIVATLRANGFRRDATARELGIAVTTLYSRIEQSPLLRKAKDIGREEILEARDRCGGDLDRMSELLEVSPRGLQLRLRELGFE
jgi:two-component system nitrogen regulation response regulator GlnG